MVAELCDLFHKTARRDCGLLFQRVERSDAVAQLRGRGKESLAPIANFLSCHENELDYEDMRAVWGLLLHLIKLDIDPEGPGPSDIMDTAGWIAWARNNAET